MGKCSRTLKETDRQIGKNIRLHRLIKEMSRAGLAGAIGVSAQQVQKYEKGVDRVAASRLFQISRVLEVPVASLFVGIDR